MLAEDVLERVELFPEQAVRDHDGPTASHRGPTPLRERPLDAAEQTLQPPEHLANERRIVEPDVNGFRPERHTDRPHDIAVEARDQHRVAQIVLIRQPRLVAERAVQECADHERLGDHAVAVVEHGQFVKRTDACAVLAHFSPRVAAGGSQRHALVGVRDTARGEVVPQRLAAAARVEIAERDRRCLRHVGTCLSCLRARRSPALCASSGCVWWSPGAEGQGLAAAEGHAFERAKTKAARGPLRSTRRCDASLRLCALTAESSAAS